MPATNWRELTTPVLLAVSLGVGGYAVSQFTGLSGRVAVNETGFESMQADHEVIRDLNKRVASIESNRYTVRDAKLDVSEMQRRMQRLELQMTRAQAKLDQLPPGTIKENQNEIRELRRRLQKTEVHVQRLLLPYDDERSHP